ncbi:hypothetical protein GCM10022232_91570 [Streptomyces plumbiresistens]|uniref:Uncharacterized protein n=1 Tax=Streptomyces plumbiresistens TaxID=511811 RepID=A0ABP7TUC2_9ACTN
MENMPRVAMTAQVPAVVQLCRHVISRLVSGERTVQAFHGLKGASALHRRGIHDSHVVAPHGGVCGQLPVDLTQRLGGLAQPLVAAALFGRVRKEMPQVGAGVAEPPGPGR